MNYRQFSRRQFLIVAAAVTALGAGPPRAAFAEFSRNMPLRRWRGISLGAQARILL